MALPVAFAVGLAQLRWLMLWQAPARCASHSFAMLRRVQLAASLWVFHILLASAATLPRARSHSNLHGRPASRHCAAAALLARHGYRRACIVGHSYGTFVASRICQLHPKARRGAGCGVQWMAIAGINVHPCGLLSGQKGHTAAWIAQEWSTRPRLSLALLCLLRLLCLADPAGPADPAVPFLPICSSSIRCACSTL